MFIRNVRTALSQPQILLEYGAWTYSRIRRAGDAIRNVHGVTIGNFADFSEYHSSIGCLSPIEYRFLTQTAFGDGAIVDIGANLGIVSLVLARRFPSREIHAIEPAPGTFEALTSNIERNGAAIRCHQIALSDAPGEISFNADPHSRATASIASAKDRHCITVPATTLDMFLEDRRIDQIALLKIDVEGYEALVFKGARRTLEELRPWFIYFEIVPDLAIRAGFAPSDAARMLVEAGYRCHRLTENGPVPVELERIEQVTLENWLAVRD